MNQLREINTALKTLNLIKEVLTEMNSKCADIIGKVQSNPTAIAHPTTVIAEIHQLRDFLSNLNNICADTNRSLINSGINSVEVNSLCYNLSSFNIELAENQFFNSYIQQHRGVCDF